MDKQFNMISRTTIYLNKPKKVEVSSKEVQPQKRTAEKTTISRTTIYLNQPKDKGNQI